MTIVGQILYAFLTVVMYLLFARAITSWFVKDLSNPIIRFLYEVTEPLLAPVRKFLQNQNIGGGTMDFSFIAVYIIVLILRSIAMQL